MKKTILCVLTLSLAFMLVLGFSSCKKKKPNTNEGTGGTTQTHTHDYKSVVTSPTCTDKGYTTYTCSCGNSYKADETPALGHKANSNEYKAPTCTEDGFSLGTTCTVCKSDLPADTRIPALGHDYRTQENTVATCTEDGVETVVCFTCENKVIRKTNATGHKITSYETEKAATCEVDGEKSGRCDNCSEYVTIVIEALGHTVGEFHYENDYCGEQRLGYSKCTACNEVVLSFGHTYTTTTVDPTCTENGSKISTCTNCGDSYSEVINCRGHIDGTWKTLIPATCTNTGLEVLDCMICGEHLETYTIDKKDHSYESTASDNKITYTCSMCSYSYVVEAETYVTVNFVTVLDGINCPPTAIKHGATASLPTLEKDGYHFDGWYFDEEYQQECTADYIFEEDVTLYALWTVSRVEGNGSVNNIVTEAPINFTFCIESSKALTNGNLSNYISIEDINGVSPKLYISSVDNNVYTIASDEYKPGMGYEVVATNGVTIVETDNNHLMFVTAKENSSHIIYKDGVVFISEDKVFTAYESEDGKTYFLFRSNLLKVGDVAVIHGDTREDIYATMKVVSMGDAEGAYIYEVEPADFDDVFEECDIYFSGEIDNENFEFSSDLEEEIIEMVESSELYAQMKYAAKQYANSVEIDNYKYKYIEMKVTPAFYKDNNNKLIVSVEITTYFNRTNKTTGKVDSILSITLKTKSVLKFGATANASSFDNFSLVLKVNNTTTVDLYVSMGSEKESNKALKYFKNLFLEAKESGAFKEIDSSSASKSKELNLGTVSYKFNGITFNIAVSNVLDLDAVGQLGINSTFTMSVKAGVQCKNGNLSSVKSFTSSAKLNFYTMGKARVEDTLKLKATASFLGSANVYIDISSGPYFEIAGATTITLTSGGKYSSNISGYIEMGITVNASTGVKAKVEYFNLKKLSWKKKTLFDKSWNLYDEDFPLFDIGQKTIPLHFSTENESITLDYTCGSEIKLPDTVDRSIVQQNLETMKISTSEVKCSYSLVKKSSYITISSKGVLKVQSKAFGNSDKLEIKIKVSYGEIYKIVTLTLNIKHTVVIDKAVAPTCTKTGLTEGKHCSKCGSTLVKQTEIPANGHTFDDTTDVTCNTCGFVRELDCKHNNTLTIPGVDATCTETGLTESIQCIDCGEVIVEQQTLDKLPHTLEVIIGKESTCTDDGLTEGERCSVCGVIIVPQIQIPAKGHTEEVLIGTDPTCTEVGLTDGKWCSVCGETTVAQEVIAAKGHDFDNEDDAICDVCGYERELKCKHTTTAIIPEIQSTCTNDGWTQGEKCSECGEITVAQEPTPALGHSYDEGVVTPPTATEYGYTTYTCYRCGGSLWNGSYKDDYIEPLGYSQGLEYTHNGNGYTVKGIGTCTDTDIVIPDTYLGEPVTEIGIGCFTYCSTLESITIPNTVTSIGSSAFAGCSGLTSVIIPDSVTNIAVGTFAGCSSLTSVTIPDSVTYIGYEMFYNCSSLTNINIPNNVTGIDYSAFEGCSSLTSVTIPNGVTSIGGYAFYGCSSLTSITIPDSVTSIGDYAFYNCSSLTTVTIGNGVTSIGEGAFSYCVSLESISVSKENNVYQSINSSLYTKDGKTLVQYAIGKPDTNFIIDDNVLNISSSAFEGSLNLTNIVIPDSVVSVSDYAFYDCSSLLYNEYDNACYLGNNDNPYIILVKAKSTDITSCTIHENTRFIDAAAFSECSNLVSITIPDSVKSIGNSAFSDCSNLSCVTISSNVACISNFAFYGCTNLTNVTFENPNGWWRTYFSTDTDRTNISATALGNPETAAEYLKSTYCEYYWHRSEE